MEITIEESGMFFKRDDQLIYKIEESQAITDLQVKKAEFVYDRGKFLEIIEAKRSIPQLDEKAAKDPKKTRDFIKEIREKFQNTISLLFSSQVGRQPKVLADIPESIKGKEYPTIDFKLYFVVNGMPDVVAMEWTQLMRNELHQFLKCWNIPDMNFIAIGDQTAKKLMLIE